MPSPLFSVVVPTRDRPEWLAQAVASILGQSVADLEVIVVDDGGVLPVVAPADARVRVVRRETNAGPAAARNTGAALAAGTYLAFLDDDDLWTPDRLELALAGLARHPIAICWSRYLDEIPRPKPVLDGNVEDCLLDQVTPSLGATALDRSLWQPLDESMPGSEDIDWWVRMVQLHHVATVPAHGQLVRRHAGPRPMTGAAGRIEGGRRVLEKHAGWFRVHRRAAAFRWLRIGIVATQAGDPRTGREALVRSFRLRPSVRTARHLWLARRMSSPTG